MKIAIHHSEKSFSTRWIKYCEAEGIEYKLVNCYETDIIYQLSGCDALMWHFSHMNSKDVLFAKQLMFALNQSGIKTFPDFNTVWHFDDKVGQKYLLESINAPLVPSYVFYTKESALNWCKNTSFPKVFKLRGGAGSSNVLLAKNLHFAIKLISKAFGNGFPQYNAIEGLKERWRKYRLHKTNFTDVLKGIIRFIYPSKYTKIAGNEKGYVYFQDFIAGNDSDIRVIVIDNKAFALKRMVRDNDFRASGSGYIRYEKELFDEQTIQLAFQLAKSLKSQCIAFDFVYLNNKPLLVEMSYGFAVAAYDKCEGFWDNSMIWHSEKFDPAAWMVDVVLKKQIEL